MSYYTKSYLSNLTEARVKNFTTLNQSIRDNKNRTSFDIFLSHSFKDKKYIHGLFLELTSKGYTVYVDWIIDPHLSRTNVDQSTVNKIRVRMKQSSSLIYATSDNASQSKWMPWELGFMDGDKSRCAILPITDYSNDSFLGQEFLSVYPIIRKGEFTSSDLVIEKVPYSSENLKNWI